MSELNQIHYGSGDNVARDKIINYTYYKSVELKDLFATIEHDNKKFSKAQKKSQQYPGDKDFKQELIEIDTHRKEQEKKVEEFKEEIRKLYEEINSIPINTERLRIVKGHFDAGEITKARSVLDAELETMKKELSILLTEKHYLADRLNKNATLLNDKANEFLILARLTIINLELPDRFEKTKNYFEESLRAEKNIINVFAYASFLQDHNQIESAISLFEELMLIFRRIIQNQKNILIPKFADVLNNLGGLKLQNKEFEIATKYLEEAISIQDKLVEKEAETYKPSLALSLNNLAKLHEDQEKFDKAIEMYTNAIAIRRQIAENENPVNLSAVADSLNDLAVCLGKKGENFEEAQNKFEEALDIQRKLNIIEPDGYLPNIAMSLDNLGNLFSIQEKIDLAEKSALEALAIRRKLYEKNPYTFSRDLAASLYNVALRFSNKEKHEEAEKLFIESLQIFKGLAQRYREAYGIDVARTSAYLCGFYFNKLQDKIKSLQYAHLAIVYAIDFLNRLPDAEKYIKYVLAFVRDWREDEKTFLENCILDNSKSKNF